MGCGASTQSGSPATPIAERAVTVGTIRSAEDDDNSPPWEYFVSHVQAETGVYAVDLWSSLRAAREKVWLDVKMDERDEEAMERGLRASKAVVCILSKSYFQRPFCVKELSWACKYDKPVIICVPSELKGYIGEFGGQSPKDGAAATVAAAPEFLRGLMKIDIKTLDRSDNKYWRVGVDMVRGAARKTIQLVLKPGATIDSAMDEALIALSTGSTHPVEGNDDIEDGLVAIGQRPDAVYAYIAVQRPPVVTGQAISLNSINVCLDGMREALEQKNEASEWQKIGCFPVSLNSGGKAFSFLVGFPRNAPFRSATLPLALLS
jgi:hypothetical protein